MKLARNDFGRSVKSTHELANTNSLPLRGPGVSVGTLLFQRGIDRTLELIHELAYGGTTMNQNAKRNLQRRKRQAARASNREYFKQKKELTNTVPVAKAKVA